MARSSSLRVHHLVRGLGALTLVIGVVAVGLHSSPAASADTPGSVTGTVTSTGGSDLAGICVSANSFDGSLNGSATTASDGTYTISGLSAGTFNVQFTNGCGNSSDYAEQWYLASATEAGATTVSVTPGDVTSNINATLHSGGTISGTVTDSSADPLADICVEIDDSGGSEEGSGSTASDGTYSITGLATDSDSVGFSLGCGNTGNYVSQWYSGAAEESGATPVEVNAGDTTSGINATLEAGGIMTGTVTDSSSAALSGICVSATGTDGLSNSAASGTDGTYAISGLATDSYTVEFAVGCGESGNYINQWYNDSISQSGSTEVPVTSGDTSTSISATMQAGGTLSGTVTDGSDIPLDGICVAVYSSGLEPIAAATSASDGTYSVEHLPTGSYTVEFSSGCGGSGSYAIQWYSGHSSQSSANTVAVTAGAVTAGIDVEMAASGSITGTVTDATTDSLLTGICVSVFDPNGILDGFVSTSDGAYSVTDLPTGSYTVSFTATCGNATNYVPQWYDLAPDSTTADTVAVVAGATTTGIDGSLAVGGTIHGWVNRSGTNLKGICVVAYHSDGAGAASTISSANGNYNLTDLAAGTYTVEFTSECGTASGFVTQWYQNEPNQASATSVTVTSGHTTRKINATMHK